MGKCSSYIIFRDEVLTGGTWPDACTYRISYNIYNIFTGGMQDWNYLHSNCFEITIELGCFKYPLAKDLKSYWTANEYALLVFMGQVREKL